MKAVIHREKFLAAFSRAAIAAPIKHNKDILCNVLLDAGERSSLSATDIEIAVRATIGTDEMTIDEPGRVLLPTGIVGQALKESSDEMLTLETDDKSATIKGQRTKHRFQLSRADDFPSVAEIEGDSLAVSALAAAVGVKAANSQTCENTRYALASVLIDVAENSTAFVGTNGSSLAAFSLDLKAKKESQSLLPMSAASKLGSFLRGATGDAIFCRNDNWIRFDVGQSSFMAKQAEGRFPRWRDVIPSGFEIECSVFCGPLVSAVRQATLTAQTDANRHLALSLNDGELELTAQSELGKSEAAIPVSLKGKPIKFALGWELLLSVLANFAPEDEIELKLIDSQSAVLFAKDNLRFVIMPLSLDR